MHIETTSLVDGTYEFIQELDGVFSEAQANIVNLTEAPNFDSEEPRSTDSLEHLSYFIQLEIESD